MNSRLIQLLQEWALSGEGADGEFLLDQSVIEYFGRKIFDDYEPSQFDNFLDRLDRWIHNVTEKGRPETSVLSLESTILCRKARIRVSMSLRLQRTSCPMAR